MIAGRKFVFIFFLVLAPFIGNAVDIDNNLEVLDIYNQKVKTDSLAVSKILDSARISFSESRYLHAVDLAGKSFELSKKFPNADFSVQSVLILARSYREMYLKGSGQSDLNNTLKYYLKAITSLESAKSKILLPHVYKEYGDFYAYLQFPELTIKNYRKAFDLISNGEDYSFQKEIIQKIATLNYDLGNLDEAILFYNRLHSLHRKLNEEKEGIDVLTILSDLYRENKDFDHAISTAKEIYEYYEGFSNEEQQIAYLSKIGEISYEAGNRDQADKAFKDYFRLAKKNDALLEKETESTRYIKNLITEGDIYTWSTDNGYWSDYSTSIRYYNDAQKYTDFQLHPDLATTILNRTGSIYYRKKEYKTCITYFDLALFYARRHNDLEAISENHILLARSYDALGKWKNASSHYELHASYMDSIIHQAERKRQTMATLDNNNAKENLKVEQTLDMIEAQERRELALVEKELLNIALVNEVELFKQDVALKEMQIQNQVLVKDSVERNYLLAKEQLANERNAKKIEHLNSEREKQDLLLKNKEAEQQNERQQIQILEQENKLAKSQQAYYVLSIVLISLILFFISFVYIQNRKANNKLRIQNEKIEQQADKLKQAYQNLELLSTIGRDITSSLIIEEIIETVYENLNTLMDASVLGIGVFEQEKNRLHFPGVRERYKRLNDIYIDLSDNNTLGAYCFNHQEEIILDNYFTSCNRYIQPKVKPVPGDGNSTSIIYLPLTIGNKQLGVLTVQSFDEGVFNEYHINIIRNIAIYAKIALENANVYKELEVQSINIKKANINIREKNKLIEEQYHQLLSINEEKNNLIKILAHDLRNPLATAMSMTELVRFEKNNLSAEQYQASEIIWRGLNRMNDMIRKILDIKAIESQKINLDYEILNANELINPLKKLFAVQSENKRIKLHFLSESMEPFIKVDRNYLIQVLENLISNALKFSFSGSNVYVRILEKDESVRISVRDEGPGIPQQDFVNLFKKFSKLSPRPTAGEQSIGLGLSIVKKYTEVMNGQVYCTSEVGKGTEFAVEFRKIAVEVS